MVVAPRASPYLCLLLEFDLGSVTDHEALPAKDHAAAAAQVCKQTALLPAEAIVARGQTVPHADLRSLRSRRFDSWSQAVEGKVVLDFCYELTSQPRLGVRITTDLARCDGVTAVRLALHCLEVLEAQEAVEVRAAKFGVNPPMPAYGVGCLRRFFNRFLLTLSILFDFIVCPWRSLYKVARGQSFDLNCPEGWMWYYRGRDYAPGEMHVFAAEAGKYKAFQGIVDKWRVQLGLNRGFFYLLNYSPFISSGVVRSVADLNCTESKVKAALATPAPPGTGPELHIVNMLMHRAAMFNNYGRHSHRFAAKPTGFCWDWLNFPGAMTAGFAISINGVFLCGIRGVGEVVDQGQKLLTDGGFGEGRRLTQITHHPKQGWGGRRCAGCECEA